MSIHERPDRLQREPTVEDIRELVGPSTPHFALHLRERVKRLMAELPADHPARLEGELQLARLDEVGHRSGEARGLGPAGGDGA